MSKRLGLLIVMMLFVSLMTGCFGSDDSSTPTPVATSSIVITGTIPALSAPAANMPNFAPVAYGTNHEMLVVNGATMTEITGSAVVINGTSYTATVPAGAANVAALVAVREKTFGKIVYSALVGNLPTAAQMSAASLTKVNVTGVNLTNETTALATIAKDKNIVAPTVPVASSVTTTNATVKSNIENAVGAATVTAIKDATAAINAVLNNSSVSPTVKNSILSTLATELKKVLEAFVTAVKDATAVVSQEIGTTTLTVGGTTISSTTTPAEVEQAVNHVTVVTVASINAVQDIIVGNGTAQTAIPFPTTVTVVMSDSTTATKTVIWSTTSTPVYNATTAGTYTFTGTVDGTTLTASVKVIVGGIQLRVSNPVFSPVGGVTYTSAQSVTITCATEGATIHYTVDGSEPTTSSPVYGAAINVATTTTIKALAVKDGMTSSEVITAVYTINIPVTLAISNGRAIKKADGTIAVTWNTNIAPTKGAKVSLINTAVPPTAGVVNYVNETSFDGTNHSVILPTTVVSVVANYNRVTIAYILSEEEIIAANIDTFEDETLNPILSTVVAVNGELTLTFTGVAVPTDVAVADFAVKNSINGSTYADVTPSAITRVSDTVVELTVPTIAATTVDQVVLYSVSYKSGTLVLSGTFTVPAQTVTKVLTAITLAKDTDTVEANVAYTLPAATAAYDDSTNAAVTATWVEVLEGGTVEVTGTSVTKTTAGTYTFMASYTEGGVTKTANFELVVTEAVPVKTLTGLTVVANPAAPTCLLGKTAEITLVVTASYINPTTTEVVTTYTTGTNYVPATKVFTPATTVAGTENIVVSYTFDGTTKTFDVPVTVTAEAPAVTTVEVTALTIDEYQDGTLAVVVKDQTGAVMTSGYTLTYSSANASVFTVATTGVVTAGAYSSTANTANVTVTATPSVAGGVAKIGTALVTVNQDKTAPTIVSATATDNAHIEVLFSERMDKTQAEIVSTDNYNIYENTTPTTSIFGGSGTSLLLPDEKTLRITLGAGKYLVGGKTYTVVANVTTAGTVKDKAGNKVANGFFKEFAGTFAQDTTAPVLQGATYNKGTGVLTLSFNKQVTNNLDYTKVTFNTLALTAATVAGSQTETNKVYATLASADKTAVEALTGDITINLTAGAVKDTVSPTPNDCAAGSALAVLTVPPTVTSATYDGATNRLVINFNAEIVNKTSLTDAQQLVKFHLYSTETGKVDVTASDYKIASTDKTKIIVELTSSVAALFEKSSGSVITTYTNAKFLIDADAVMNYGDINNTANLVNYTMSGTTLSTGGATLTVTPDTTKPVLNSAVYTESTKKLVLTFSKAVSNLDADIVQASLKIKSNASAPSVDTNLIGIAQSDITETAPLTTLTINLTTNAAVAVTNMKTAFRAGEKIYFYMDANTVKDINATGNDALAYGVTELQYKDDVAPAISGNINAVDKRTIKVTFDEKVTGETVLVGNFKVYRTSLGATEGNVTISSVTLDSTEKIVTLSLGADQLNSIDYTFVATGVKDNSGNATTGTTTDSSLKTYTGNGGAVVAANLVKAEIIDAGTSNVLDQNDKLKLTFDKPVQFKSGYTAATLNEMFKLKVGAGGETAIFDAAVVANKLASAEFATTSFVVSGSTVTLQLAAGVKLDDLGTVKIGTKTGGAMVIVDETTTDVAAGVFVTIETPVAAPKVASVVYSDVDASGSINAGDTILVTFGSEMQDVTAGTTTLAKTDLSVILADGSAYTGSRGLGSNYTLTFTSPSKTALITLASDVTLLTTDLKLAYLAVAGNKIKDSWGLKLAAITTGDTTNYTNRIAGASDTTSPYLTSVVWVESTPNYYLLTFNEPVFYAGTLGNTPFAMKNGVIFSNTTTVTKSAANQLKVVSTDTITPNITKVDVENAAGVASNAVKAAIVDSYNNAVTVVPGNTGALGVTATSPTETTGPAITKAEFISADRIVVTFDKAVQLSTATNLFSSATSRFTESNAGGTANKRALYPDATATFSTQVVFNVTTAVSTAIQTSGLTTDLLVAADAVRDSFGNPNASLASPMGVTIAGDKTVASIGGGAYNVLYVSSTEVSVANIDNFFFSNALHTVVGKTGMTAFNVSEPVTVEMYVGTTAPGAATEPTAYSAAAITSLAAGDSVITGIAAQTASQKVYYRFADKVGNKTSWLLATTAVLSAAALPDATYKLANTLAGVTEAGEAYYDSTAKTLAVYGASGNTVYDVAANATVISIATNLTKNDTPASADSFTVASGKVSAISAANNIAGAAGVALTAADCAASVNVTSHATNILTLTASAAGQATNLVIVAGAVTASDVNLTGTITVTATAAATLVAGTKAVTVSALSHDSSLDTTGALTISADLTGKLTLAANPSGITANGSAIVDPVALNAVVADVATGKTLTLDDSNATGTLTVTKTSGTGKIVLATNIPTGITANGDAIVDPAALTPVITNVADAKTLTLADSDALGSLTITATTGTGKVKLTTNAPAGITANGSASVAADLVAITVADVAAGATLSIVDATSAPTDLTVTSTNATGKVVLVDAITGNLVATAGNLEIGDGTTDGSTVGGTVAVAAPANVTVKSTGDITGTTTLADAYAGTWNSSAKNLAGGFTVTTTSKLVGSITLNVADVVITTTTVTHQKATAAYEDASITTTATGANGATSDIAGNAITLASIAATADTFTYGVSAGLATTAADQRFKITASTGAGIVIVP